MSSFSFYHPASPGRRFAAFLVNAMLTGMPAQIFKSLGIDKEGQLSSPLVVFLILVFCLFPESPGKRLLNLVIRDSKQTPIAPKIRLYRVLPCLLFFGVVPLASLGQMGVRIVAMVMMVVLLFVTANALTIVLSSEKMSLLDMRLGTRVLTPTKLPGQEMPDLFGIKVQ